METLRRFDVAEYNSVLMVVVESDLLPPDTAVVVVPLLESYPSTRFLNPVILFQSERLVLATRLIAPVRRTALSHVGNVEEAGEKIVRAIDTLISGI